MCTCVYVLTTVTEKHECASRDMYYMWDASWFSLDKVGAL